MPRRRSACPPSCAMRPSSVCLVGFEVEAGESDPLTQALRAALEREGVDVGDRLVVRDGRWFTAGCDCCPPGGRPLPEPADVPAVADYVALGHSVLDDRDSLVALVRPAADADPLHAETRAAVDAWQARYTLSVAMDRIRARRRPTEAGAHGGPGDRPGDGPADGPADGPGHGPVDRPAHGHADGPRHGPDGDRDRLWRDDADASWEDDGSGGHGATVIDLETRQRRAPGDFRR